MNNATVNLTIPTYIITAPYAAVATVALFLVFLYVLVLATILRNPTEFNNSYYTLIVALAVSDFFTLSFAIYRLLFGKQYLGSVSDQAYIFLFNAVGWHNGLHLNVSISMNRVFAIAFFSKYQTFFTILKARCLAALCFLGGFGCQTAFLYIPRNVAVTLDLIVGNTLISSVLLAYIISVAVCIKNMKNVSSMTKVSYVREVKLLMQGCIVSTLLFVVEILYWFPLVDLVEKCFLIMATGLNPLIYLAMDSKLRRLLLKKTGIRISDSTGAKSLVQTTITTTFQ